MPADDDRTNAWILGVRLDEHNDTGAETVRDYLIELLAKLWRDEADFNSKRPFGNSGWQYDVYAPLIRAGVISGTFDEWGYVDDCDTRRADELITAAIHSLRGPEAVTTDAR